MKLNIKQFYKVSILLFLLMSNTLFGQGVEMADKMRDEGKIYVVVAVLATVFIGIIIYLILQDNRIKKIEKEIENR